MQDRIHAKVRLQLFMRDLQQRAHDILSAFTGYPDLPTGRPCGVLAYMFAHGRRRIPLPSVSGRSIDVPFFNAQTSRPARPYYAVIETNPSQVTIATLAKGAQDLIAQRGTERMVVELGQPRDLARHLANLGAPRPDGDQLCRPVGELHIELVATLLAQGWEVRIETPFEAAVRETREEHGFDLIKSWDGLRSIEPTVALALSKRRPSMPIEHYLYLAEVVSFDATVPAHSVIVEEKNPERFGQTYEEWGVYLTLQEMWHRLHQAEASLQARPELRRAAAVELVAVRSRLLMLGRFERRIMARAGEVLPSSPHVAAAETCCRRVPGWNEWRGIAATMLSGVRDETASAGQSEIYEIARLFDPGV